MYALSFFLLHVVFQGTSYFILLFLGLTIPKYALLGVFDLFVSFSRMDNHSSQFGG